MYRLVRPFFFKMSPETAHDVVIGGLKQAQRLPGGSALIRGLYGVKEHKELGQELWGIRFHNPIGLGAGLDKEGEAVKGFSAMGFGFIEVGTVTPKAQPGNEKPRCFRLPPDEALINRMGFNNHGADAMAARLAQVKKRSIPVAINIGKNKLTENEHAADDYVTCMDKLYDVGEFFVINISSPNTPNLRALQHGGELQSLLRATLAKRDEKHKQCGGQKKPVLLKIAPDLSQDELGSIAETALACGIDGMIATNTTIARPSLQHPNQQETGGLSGRPLTKRSTEVVRELYKIVGTRVPIIGCGGIFSGQDAYEKIRAGATMLEIYTSLIYKGPGVVSQINRELLTLLKRDGFSHISQAIGVDA